MLYRCERTWDRDINFPLSNEIYKISWIRLFLIAIFELLCGYKIKRHKDNRLGRLYYFNKF